MERCRCFAQCNAAAHIREKCTLHEPHAENEEHQKGHPCPLGVIFGYSDRTSCFKIKEVKEHA